LSTLEWASHGLLWSPLACPSPRRWLPISGVKGKAFHVLLFKHTPLKFQDEMAWVNLLSVPEARINLLGKKAPINALQNLEELRDLVSELGNKRNKS
jgi:hypothetical protein